MGDEGVTAICEAVQSNKETKLASLDIQYNFVGPAGAKSVAAMMAVIASITEVCQIRKLWCYYPDQDCVHVDPCITGESLRE